MAYVHGIMISCNFHTHLPKQHHHPESVTKDFTQASILAAVLAVKAVVRYHPYSASVIN